MSYVTEGFDMNDAFRINMSSSHERERDLGDQWSETLKDVESSSVHHWVSAYKCSINSWDWHTLPRWQKKKGRERSRIETNWNKSTMSHTPMSLFFFLSCEITLVKGIYTCHNIRVRIVWDLPWWAPIPYLADKLYITLFVMDFY